jgi:hypothetical protein
METKAIVHCSLWLVVLGGLAVSENAYSQFYYPNPQATTPADGSYTVSYAPNCNNYPPEQIDCVFTYLQEKVEPSGTWSNVSLGSGSISFTNKPPGTYSYRVYLGLYAIYYGYGEYTTSAISVVVANDPVRDDITTQASYSYEVRQGYFDADSNIDLFVQKVSGGDPYNGVVEEVILQQGAVVGGVPTFSLVVPTSGQASAASAWPVSAADPILKDINVDGFLDVLVSNVSSVIANAPTQIVYAPGQVTVAEPLGLKAIDDSVKMFAENSLDYLVNPDYFVDNVPIYYFQAWIWYAYCGSYGFPDLDSDYWDYFSDCYIDYVYVSGYYVDFSVFNQDAVAIWYNEEQIATGSISRADGLDQIEAATEDAISEDGETVSVGGWPMEEDFEDGVPTDPDYRRGLELIWPVLGVADALAQEDEIEPEEANVAPRVPDTVYITAHRVYGAFPYHMALEHRILPCKCLATTLSAGPESGDLVAGLNRPTDHPMTASNLTMAVVGPPGSPGANTPFQLFQSMIQAQLNYDNDLDYCYFPDPGDGCYNSNSYIRGLVEKTNGVVNWSNSIGKNSWDDFEGGGSRSSA